VIALLWAGAGACLLAAAALLVRRSRVGPFLKVAGAGSFGAARRRTTLLWTTFATSLVAVLAVFAVRANATVDAPILRPGADAVIVIDVSGSALSASEGIGRVLSALTQDPRRRLGLVLFSDSAYEALPPSTPAEAVKGWLEVFASGGPWNYPWAPIAGGTRISSGLVLARKLVKRDDVENPHIVLVSDLADAEADLQRLETVTAQYEREGIDLSVVRVSPGVVPARGTLEELPNAAFVAKAASRTVDPGRSSDAGAAPFVLAALVGVLGLLAAANELALRPLTWGQRA